MNVAFTLSSSYSGSTLLSFLLNAHPQIATISESDPLGNIKRDPDFMCSCGVPIRRCAFFGDVARAMEVEGVDFDVENMGLVLSLARPKRLNDLLCGRIPLVQSSRLEDLRDRVVDLLPAYRRRKAETHRRNDAFMRAVLRLTGATVFLDANKDPYRMRFFRRRHDVFALYLYKNGIAGAYSFVRHGRRNSPPLGVEAASHRWFKEQITISRSLAYLPRERVMHVPYSELCGDVRGTLRRVYHFLGVPDVDTPHPNDVAHHVVGNAMRLGRIDEVTERETWREELSPSEVDAYRRVYDLYIDRIEKLNPELAPNIWR